METLQQLEMLVDCTSGGDNIGHGKSWWGYAQLLPQLKPSRVETCLCQYEERNWVRMTCLNTHDPCVWTFPHFSRLKRSVCESKRERQRALWRTASVLRDMGQGGDVEAYFSHQATHASGKCTLHIPEGIESREVCLTWDERDRKHNLACYPLLSDVVGSVRGSVLFVLTAAWSFLV